METHFSVTGSKLSREPLPQRVPCFVRDRWRDVDEAPRFQCRREHARDWRSGGNTVHKPTQKYISVGSNGNKAGACADACVMCSGRHRNVANCRVRADPYGPKRLDAQNTTGRLDCFDARNGVRTRDQHFLKFAVTARAQKNSTRRR